MGYSPTSPLVVVCCLPMNSCVLSTVAVVVRVVVRLMLRNDVRPAFVVRVLHEPRRSDYELALFFLWVCS